jgi:trans-2-enoyl-CoA reductase
MERMSPANISTLADVEGFRTDFLRVHGFEVEGVDYEAEVSPLGRVLRSSSTGFSAVSDSCRMNA